MSSNVLFPQTLMEGIETIPKPVIFLSSVLAGTFLLSYFTRGRSGQTDPPSQKLSPDQWIVETAREDIAKTILENRDRRRRGPGCGELYIKEINEGTNRIAAILDETINNARKHFSINELIASEKKAKSKEGVNWESMGQLVLEQIQASLAVPNDSLKYRGPKANEIYEFLIQEYTETAKSCGYSRSVIDALLEDRLVAEYEIEIEDLENRPDLRQRQDIQKLQQTLLKLRKSNTSPYTNISLFPTL